MSNSGTPRDWLLARHHSVAPSLDAMRRAALSTARYTWRDFLRELFLPHRTAWAALAAIWLALTLFHLTDRRPSQPIPTNPPHPDAIAVWLAQLDSNETFAQIDRRP